MTPTQLDTWAETAGIQMISAYTVPWAALDHPDAPALAMKWIASTDPNVATSGWCAYSGIVTTTPDESLDLAEISGLLDLIVQKINDAPNRVKQNMNSFIIAVGSYVLPLAEEAKAAAKKIGVVKVDMGDTACKVPSALEYIAKMETSGKQGQKRKTIRC